MQENFGALKDGITGMANEKVSEFLGSQDYNQDQVQKWTSQISEELIKALKGVTSNFKFCVSCLILQKGDAGMHMSSTCYWDSNTDGSATIKWENSSMYCILNIYGISF